MIKPAGQSSARLRKQANQAAATHAMKRVRREVRRARPWLISLAASGPKGLPLLSSAEDEASAAGRIRNQGWEGWSATRLHGSEL